MLRLARQPDDSRSTGEARFDFARVCYYTSVVGDAKIVDVKSKLSKIIYKCKPEIDTTYTAQLYPIVFKKSAKSQKTRNVDIRIVIDVMRCAFSQAFALLFVISGDGDYLLLLEEVMRQGSRSTSPRCRLGSTPR